MIKKFMLVYFIVYMLVAFVLPSIRIYRQTGINPITFGREDNAHNFIGKCFKLLLALIPASLVALWIEENIYAYFLPVHYLEGGVFQWTGIALCILSLLWTIVAQWQMGESWRIGIDEENKTSLVTNGLFSVSRNPIFLGMQITLLGMFFLMPNALTLLVLVCGSLLIQIQVRLEEEFLMRLNGMEYETYKKQVGRFI